MRIPIERSAPAPSPDAPALSELLRRLVAAYDPERVYLFGSVARGSGQRLRSDDYRAGRCSEGTAVEPSGVSGDAGNRHGGRCAGMAEIEF
jgi:hypothetical protein